MNEESLFAAAMDKANLAERRAFLDNACGDNVQLRRRIDRLLAAADETVGILECGPVAGQLSPEEALAPQQVFAGRFKLCEKVGEGGMGEVWVADQTEPVQRRIALKVIRTGIASSNLLERFHKELQTLALMDHPNIARVYDAGYAESRLASDEEFPHSNSRPYFVMELVNGEHIDKYCDQTKLSLRQRLELFIPVCQAVQHAHQKGIIHRDLKPSNILVGICDGEPVPKVIDFGVAKAAGPRSSLSLDGGGLIGTLEYMSPEQLDVNNRDIDTRSDIYGLGIVLYQLLTGVLPIPRASLQSVSFPQMIQILKKVEPVRPSVRLSQLRKESGGKPEMQSPGSVDWGSNSLHELDWIIIKCLAKDRSRRYVTAEALAQDIRNYLHDQPLLAAPPRSAYRLKKFVQRNKRAVAAAALIVTLLAVGIIGTTWGMIRATAAQAIAENEAIQKQAALEAVQRSEREAKEQLFLALWSQARAGRFSRQMGQRLNSLDALTKAARIRRDDQLRDEAIAAMALPDIRRVPGWRSSSPDNAMVAYGGQYRLYARASGESVVIRSIPDDREVRRIAAPGYRVIYMCFSPDERFLLAKSEGNALRVWRVADGQRLDIGERRDCQGHAFSPDGRRLAVALRRPGVSLSPNDLKLSLVRQPWICFFELETGQELMKIRLRATACTLAFHPDNQKLAVGYIRANYASVYDSLSRTHLVDLPVGTMMSQVVTWHPDGNRLAVGGSDPRVQIWNLAAKRKVATLQGHVQQVTALTFHPHGQLLASHGWDGMLFLWDASSGRQLLRLTSVNAPNFSADGKWLGIAQHGEKTDLLEVAPCHEYRTLVSSVGAGKGRYNQGDISPDGRLLAVGMNDGARLWDLRSGRELAVLPTGTIYVYFDCPHPNAAKRGRWSLLTSGWAGLQRRQLASNDKKAKTLSVGPPQQLSMLQRAWFARGPDGRTLAAATQEGSVNQILDLEKSKVRRALSSHPDGDVRALSRDGRWAASCGWHSDRVRLWNIDTGAMVHEWNVGKRIAVFFTPDSRTLIISRGDEFSFWDVATLKLIRRLRRDVAQYPGYVAFSPDGRLMALEMAPAVVHLKEIATGQTVAKLEDPHGDRATWMGFTPDGAQLAVIASYASAIHIWDLRAIRAGLKELNLDWDWPELPLK